MKTSTRQVEHGSFAPIELVIVIESLDELESLLARVNKNRGDINEANTFKVRADMGNLYSTLYNLFVARRDK